MKNHMQTIGIISDIHGNYPALEAILEHMAHEQVDTLYFLGDYITDGPEPQRTLALLRQAAQHFSVLFIRGNREQYLIDHANHPEQVWKPGPARVRFCTPTSALRRKTSTGFALCPSVTASRMSSFATVRPAGSMSC